MIITTPAIVLNPIRIADNSHIVHLYTREYGPLSVMVKGSKRASIRSVFMHPLSLIEVVINQRKQQTLHHVKESKPLRILQTIHYEPVKSAIAMFMAEWLSHTLKEEHPDEHLFDFIKQSIETFDCLSQGYANFHLIFLVKLTHFLGIFPNLSNFSEGVYFDLQNGEFTKVIPLHKHYLNPTDTLSFAHILRLNYDQMHLFHLNRTERQRILQEIEQYYRLHIPAFGTIRSLAILEQLFN